MKNDVSSMFWVSTSMTHLYAHVDFKKSLIGENYPRTVALNQKAGDSVELRKLSGM